VKQPDPKNVLLLQEAAEAFLAGPRGFGSDIWKGFAVDAFPAQMLCAALEARDPGVLGAIAAISGVVVGGMPPSPPAATDPSAEYRRGWNEARTAVANAAYSVLNKIPAK